MINLIRHLGHDFFVLIMMIWGFVAIGCWIYGAYCSYALVDSFRREQKWPQGWFKKTQAFLAFNFSPNTVIELYFSSDVSAETKSCRKRLYFAWFYFLISVAVGAGLILLWRLINGTTA